MSNLHVYAQLNMPLSNAKYIKNLKARVENIDDYGHSRHIHGT